MPRIQFSDSLVSLQNRGNVSSEAQPSLSEERVRVIRRIFEELKNLKSSITRNSWVAKVVGHEIQTVLQKLQNWRAVFTIIKGAVGTEENFEELVFDFTRLSGKRHKIVFSRKGTNRTESDLLKEVIKYLDQLELKFLKLEQQFPSSSRLYAICGKEIQEARREYNKAKDILFEKYSYYKSRDCLKNGTVPKSSLDFMENNLEILEELIDNFLRKQEEVKFYLVRNCPRSGEIFCPTTLYVLSSRYSRNKKSEEIFKILENMEQILKTKNKNQSFANRVSELETKLQKVKNKLFFSRL